MRPSRRSARRGRRSGRKSAIRPLFPGGAPLASLARQQGPHQVYRDEARPSLRASGSRAGRLSPQSTTEWTSSIRISPLLGILRVRMPPRPIPNRQREIVREFSIMITLSGQSLHPINDSDSASRTERKGSPRRPPGESEDAALSPYAPKRARLMREGKPLAIDVPRFLLPPRLDICKSGAIPACDEVA